MKDKYSSVLEDALCMLEQLNSEQINTLNNSITIFQTLELIDNESQYTICFNGAPLLVCRKMKQKDLHVDIVSEVM